MSHLIVVLSMRLESAVCLVMQNGLLRQRKLKGKLMSSLTIAILMWLESAVSLVMQNGLLRKRKLKG